MLDLVHFFTFTCHGLLNLWLSCKVNEQVGGHAPKSGAAAGLARAFFYKVYRFLGGYTPKKHWILSRETGWSCSEFCSQKSMTWETGGLRISKDSQKG